MTFYDVFWRLMSMGERDGNCHKMSQSVFSSALRAERRGPQAGIQASGGSLGELGRLDGVSPRSAGPSFWSTLRMSLSCGKMSENVVNCRDCFLLPSPSHRPPLVFADDSLLESASMLWIYECSAALRSQSLRKILVSVKLLSAIPGGRNGCANFMGA